MNIRFFGALAAALLLAACDGGDSSPTSGTDRDHSRVASPLAPNIGYPGRLRLFANSRHYTDAARCEGFVCTYDVQGETITFDLDDLDPTGALKRHLGQAQQTNGITHAVARFREEGVNYLVYAGWGEYQAFTEVFGQATVDGTDIDVMLPLSMGNSSGTNPVAGSATWHGIMVGRRYADLYPWARIGRRVTGDATITADFADMNVDVTFSRIVERGGGALGDLYWTDLPISDGGFEGNGLYAIFYGPNHEEVGGVFDVEGLSGAFGASR